MGDSAPGPYPSCHLERNMVIGEAEDHVESKDPYSLHNRRYPDSPLHQNEKGRETSPSPDPSMKMKKLEHRRQRSAAGFVRLAKMALAAELCCGSSRSVRNVDRVRVVRTVNEEVRLVCSGRVAGDVVPSAHHGIHVHRVLVVASRANYVGNVSSGDRGSVGVRTLQQGWRAVGSYKLCILSGGRDSRD